MNGNNKGKFIVFEGIDGSGKSTLTALLEQRMKEHGAEVYTTYEPTGSPFGSLIRNILNKRIAADDKTIGALFLADRLDHIRNPVDGMLHYINRGIHVISDRYYYSSYAYHAPMLDMEWIRQANSVCAELLKPDIIFYIDVTVETALERIRKSRHSQDLFETREKMELVTANYHKAIAKWGDSDHLVTIDGNRPPEVILNEIWQHVSKLLK